MTDEHNPMQAGESQTYHSGILRGLNVIRILFGPDHEAVPVRQPNIILGILHLQMLTGEVPIHNDCGGIFPSRKLSLHYLVDR